MNEVTCEDLRGYQRSNSIEGLESFSHKSIFGKVLGQKEGLGGPRSVSIARYERQVNCTMMERPQDAELGSD